jgi:hypothetical protein
MKIKYIIMTEVVLFNKDNLVDSLKENKNNLEKQLSLYKIDDLYVVKSECSKLEYYRFIGQRNKTYHPTTLDTIASIKKIFKPTIINEDNKDVFEFNI